MSAAGQSDGVGRDTLENMSAFRVNVTARNPKYEEQATPPVEALVDTGSELTWLPADLLRAAGITPRRKRVFAPATLLGVRTLEGFGVAVDNIAHRFVATTTIVANACSNAHLDPEIHPLHLAAEEQQALVDVADCLNAATKSHGG